MRKMISMSMPRAALLGIAPLLVMAACTKADQPAVGARQVELAPAPSTQPQLADTARGALSSPTTDRRAAAAPTNRASSSAPARPGAAAPVEPPAAAAASAVPAAAQTTAAASAPASGIISGGASLNASMSGRVCTNTHRAGDRVTATLASPVSGTNGAVLPAGAAVTLRVTESARGENGKEGIRLAFEPVSVSFGGAVYAVAGSASVAGLETVRAQTTGDQAKKVAAGAAIGALAGQLLGRKTRTTVTGAVVGAAAGGAIAAGSADWNGCVAGGAAVTVRLSAPVTVRAIP